jgi:hypothetical protein
VDAYRIGVSIVLANGVSPVLAIIGRDLLGLHTSTGAIQRNFAGWATALAGVGGILAGATILGAMTKLAEKAADFQDAMTKVSQLNPKVAALVNSGEMQRMAFRVGGQLGMKVEDVTNVYGGIYGAIQDPAEATEITPYAAAYARLMQMRHPGSHPEESIRTLVKAGELAGRLYDADGKIDPAKVKEWFDMAAIAEAATHGQVNAQALYGMAQQAGPGALRGLSKEGYEHMMILSQEMGGQRAGTSLLSLRNQMTGAMLARSADAMARYGVLGSNEYEVGKGDHVHMTEAGSRRLLGLLNEDPVKFVDMMVDKLKEKGITDKDDQMRAITEMVGRQTSQRLVSDIVAQRQQIDRETGGLNQGLTVDQGLAGYNSNIHAGMQNVAAAWHNLLVAISDPESDRLGLVLNRIASAINTVTDTVRKLTPEQIDTIFKVIAGVGAGLIVLGGMAMMALIGMPAMIAAAIVAVGTLAAVAIGHGENPFAGISKAIANALKIEVDSLSFSGVFAGIGTRIWQALKSEVSTEIDGITRDLKNLGITPGGSGTSPGKTGKPWHPTRFEPGRDSGRAGPTTLALNIDGRTMAQATIDSIDGMTTFPSQAPTPDGTGRYFAGDHNSWDT